MSVDELRSPRPGSKQRRRAGDGSTARIAANRERQRELYGAPLGDRVRALTTALGVTQARLARALGISPAMLSQLVSARRVKIGDPAVLARLVLLDRRCAEHGRITPSTAEALLAEVARAELQWSAPVPADIRVTDAPPVPAPRPAIRSRPKSTTPTPAEVLRSVATPARLAAAAATLAPAFPELAEVLRQAAARPS